MKMVQFVSFMRIRNNILVITADASFYWFNAYLPASATLHWAPFVTPSFKNPAAEHMYHDSWANRNNTFKTHTET